MTTDIYCAWDFKGINRLIIFRVFFIFWYFGEIAHQSLLYFYLPRDPENIQVKKVVKYRIHSGSDVKKTPS